MRQSTLVLTGFGISWDTGAFEYHPWDHYIGPVDVMGFHAANGSENKGKDVGLAYVDYLAHHPATAERIARKLCYGSSPTSRRTSLVDALADVLPRQRHRDRARAREAVPLHGVRGLGGREGAPPVRGRRRDPAHPGHQARPAAASTGIQGLYWMLEGLGTLPMGWVPPNGYPDDADPWRSAGLTLSRWNMHLSLAAGWWPRTTSRCRTCARTCCRHDAARRRTARSWTRSPSGWCSARSRRRTATPSSRSSGVTPRTHSTRDDAAVDWRLPYLVALILDTPSHGIR